jgi:hypothetical protein
LLAYHRHLCDLFPRTDSCELPHVAVVQEGRLHVVMDDGSQDEFGPNDVMLLPPGHDAWSAGDQAVSQTAVRRCFEG